MTANKNMMILMMLAIIILAVALFVVSTSFNFQFASEFDAFVGHCVGSSCSSIG